MAVLSLVALVQGAFILKTQFTPAESAPERPTSAQPVPVAPTQPEVQNTIAPADVAAASPSPVRSSVATQPVTGRLIVRSDPAGAKVLVDGRSQGVTPVDLAGVAAGSHRVVVSIAGREVQQAVHIEAGSTASIVVPLRSTERSTYGRVSVSAPLEVDIFEGGTLVGTSRMPELILLPGSHTLRLVNEAFGFEDTRTIEVAAGARVSLPVHVPHGELNVNALPWAEVSIDGTRIGETPLGNLKLAVGPHVATFRHPELGEKTVPFAVKVGVPARVTADLRK